MRTLFQLDTEKDGGEAHPNRSWLVLAVSEGEAQQLIPDSFRVDRILACGHHDTSESRVIGWMGESAWRRG